MIRTSPAATSTPPREHAATVAAFRPDALAGSLGEHADHLGHDSLAAGIFEHRPRALSICSVRRCVSATT
jgi:hypothetical protein